MFLKVADSPVNSSERRLLNLAAAFLALYTAALTLAPAVRARAWTASLNWDAWLAFVTWLIIVNLLHRASATRLPHRDPFLIPAALLLTGWGQLTIWRLYPSFGLRQTLWLIVSAGLFLLGLRLPADLRPVRRYKYAWLTGGLLLTALTLLFGANPSGNVFPHLWLGCCGLYVQPSEPLKLLLVIYLAAYLADRLAASGGIVSLSALNGSQRASLEKLFRIPLLPLLAPTLLLTGLALLLLAIQRDLGTASIFLFLYTVIIYIASGRKRVLLFGIGAILLAGVAGYWLFDVVRVRVEAWLNPWLDPSGRSYQIVQSLLAIANGGLLGRGPGMGSPRLVPIAHSDFVFASVTEEGGLVGALAILLLVGLIAQRGIRVALQADDPFRRYLAAGLSTYLAAQSLLIIGGNIRLLPLTGVTLPFVSYGGSSLVTAFLALLLLTIISNPTEREERLSLPYDRRPYINLYAFLLAGVAAASLITGWWSLVRGPDLLARTDNPRRAIADRYVKRGSLFDRRSNALSLSEGAPGSYVRRILVPGLSPLLGYTHPVYGQAGLEAGMDVYLRGVQGYPGLTLWWNHLLYGQPPPGLDLRLSLDAALQDVVDRQLGGQKGALVVLNAATGEILASASHPSFDANTLESDWNTLVQDPDSPLLNRAMQGRYPVGTALTPFLLAAALGKEALPPPPDPLTYILNDQVLDCALPPGGESWEAATRAGCPNAAATLGFFLGSEKLQALFAGLGLYTSPSLPVPVAEAMPKQEIHDPTAAGLGLELSISPLQAALAAATLSASGVRPAPFLVTAVNSPETGWTALSPQGKPVEALPPQAASAAAQALAEPDGNVWESAGSASAPPGAAEPETDRAVNWFLTGTLADWGGQPMVVVVVLEEGSATQAQAIGRAVLSAAMQREG